MKIWLLSVLDGLMFQVWYDIKSKHLPSQWTHCAWLKYRMTVNYSSQSGEGKEENLRFNSTHFHLRQDKSRTGAMCDMSHGIVTEISNTAVSWLFIEPMRTAVPGMICQSGHAAVRQSLFHSSVTARSVPSIGEMIFVDFFHLFICAYNVWVISPPYPLPSPFSPFPFPLTPSLPGRNCSALICNFVEERVLTIIRKTKHFF
jgi:hypothetical protein